MCGIRRESLGERSDTWCVEIDGKIQIISCKMSMGMCHKKIACIGRWICNLSVLIFFHVPQGRHNAMRIVVGLQGGSIY